MALNIKPLSDRVLVEPVAAETQTASGIFIPDTAKEKPQKGKVVAVGNGKKDEPLTVKVGDTINFTVNMEAPKASGSYTTVWVLRASAKVFCKMSLSINVR